MKTTRPMASAVATATLVLFTAGVAAAAPPTATDDVATWDPAAGPCLLLDALANDDPTLTGFSSAAFSQGSGTFDDIYSDELRRSELEVCPSADTEPGSQLVATYEAFGIYDADGHLRANRGEASTASATVTITVAGPPPVGPMSTDGTATNPSAGDGQDVTVPLQANAAPESDAPPAANGPTRPDSRRSDSGPHPALALALLVLGLGAPVLSTRTSRLIGAL